MVCFLLRQIRMNRRRVEEKRKYTYRVHVSEKSAIMKQIVKSLFIVASVDLSGWFLTPGLFLLAQLLNLTREWKMKYY